MAAPPVLWPGEPHGQPMGSQRVGQDRATFTYVELPHGVEREAGGLWGGAGGGSSPECAGSL